MSGGRDDPIHVPRLDAVARGGCAPGAAGANAQQAQQPAPLRSEPSRRTRNAALAVELTLEPKAIDILKAASGRLAAARTMRFTAVVSYESPSLLGPPLVYTTKSEVVLQRPDKLRVITSGDGPASEFYYDGKTMMAFEPAANLVAIAEAPPTIDAALKAAYDSAAIYFPFTDVIVADPYGDIAEGLKLAFYIGQSHVVGGTTTDMVAYANDGVFVQIWIGAEDKLPRMVRAVYRNDPAQLRHQMELSNWQLDLDRPAGRIRIVEAPRPRRGSSSPAPTRSSRRAPAAAEGKPPSEGQAIQDSVRRDSAS